MATAKTELVAQVQQKFNSMPPQRSIYIPDTNALIHYQPLTQIDWGLATGELTAEIWITIPVLNELENKKTVSQSRKLSKKAGSVLNSLNRLRRERVKELAPGFDIVFDGKDPLRNFEELALDRSNNDNRLLVRAIEISEHASVTLITDDSGLQVRCEGHGVKYIELPDKCRVQLEDDPLEIEVRQLRLENSRLQSEHPRLTTAFKDATRNIVVELVELVSHTEEDRARYLREHQEKYPPWNAKKKELEPGLKSLSRMLAIRFAPVPSGEVEEYNDALTEHHAQVEACLEDFITATNRTRRTFVMDVVLQNEGGKPGEMVELTVRPASNCKLHATLPDHFKDLPQAPTRPEPKRLPSYLDAPYLDPKLDSSLELISTMCVIPKREPAKPPEFLDQPDGGLLIRFSKVLHQHKYPLPQIWVEIDEHATGTQLFCGTYAENQPTNVETTLSAAISLITSEEHERRSFDLIFKQGAKAAPQEKELTDS